MSQAEVWHVVSWGCSSGRNITNRKVGLWSWGGLAAQLLEAGDGDRLSLPLRARGDEGRWRERMPTTVNPGVAWGSQQIQRTHPQFGAAFLSSPGQTLVFLFRMVLCLCSFPRLEGWPGAAHQRVRQCLHLVGQWPRGRGLLLSSCPRTRRNPQILHGEKAGLLWGSEVL